MSRAASTRAIRSVSSRVAPAASSCVWPGTNSDTVRFWWYLRTSSRIWILSTSICCPLGSRLSWSVRARGPWCRGPASIGVERRRDQPRLHEDALVNQWPLAYRTGKRRHGIHVLVIGGQHELLTMVLTRYPDHRAMLG